VNSQEAVDYLEGLAAQEWSDERALGFEKRFGDDIRRLLVLHLWRLGFVEYRFDPTRAEQILSTRKFEMYENTLTDTWIALLDGLVGKYIKDLKSGRIKQEFRAYLSGVIHHLVIKNAQELGLIPRDSVAELLRSLCEAKKDTTKIKHIARVKQRLWVQVERMLLAKCGTSLFQDVYKRIYHVVDYFFEEFLPGQCRAISKSPPRKALVELVAHFSDAEYDKAKDYIGSITPYSSDARITSFVDSEQQEDEALLQLVGVTS